MQVVEEGADFGLNLIFYFSQLESMTWLQKMGFIGIFKINYCGLWLN